MTDREQEGRLGTVGTTVKLTTGAFATHAPDRLEDHINAGAPAHICKRFADMRTLYA